ncbi:MAG: hypothetical protein HC882_10025 [Acidobacteria bacterium]|nr:hypothetical protein [Acidobacteriota bacterium]
MSIHAIVRSIVVVLVICCAPAFVQAGEYDVVLGEDESFLLLSRDDRNDAIRAALLRNPGLVEAFGAEAGAHLRWVAPAGTNGIEDLDANQIRVLSSGATYWLGDLGLIAYFDQVAAYLDANPALKDIVINTPDLSYATSRRFRGSRRAGTFRGRGRGCSRL